MGLDQLCVVYHSASGSLGKLSKNKMPSPRDHDEVDLGQSLGMFILDKLLGDPDVWPGLESPELVDSLDPVTGQSVRAAELAEAISRAEQTCVCLLQREREGGGRPLHEGETLPPVTSL